MVLPNPRATEPAHIPVIIGVGAVQLRLGTRLKQLQSRFDVHSLGIVNVYLEPFAKMAESYGSTFDPVPVLVGKVLLNPRVARLHSRCHIPECQVITHRESLPQILTLPASKTKAASSR